MRLAVIISVSRGSMPVAEVMSAVEAHESFKRITSEQTEAWEEYALNLKAAKETGAIAPDDSELLEEIRLWTSDRGEVKKRRFSLPTVNVFGASFGGGYDKAIDDQRKANGDTVLPKSPEPATPPAPAVADPVQTGSAPETTTIPQVEDTSGDPESADNVDPLSDEEEKPGSGVDPLSAAEEQPPVPTAAVEPVVSSGPVNETKQAVSETKPAKRETKAERKAREKAEKEAAKKGGK